MSPHRTPRFGRTRSRIAALGIVGCAALTTTAAAAVPPGYQTLRAVTPQPKNAKYVSPAGDDANSGSRARPWRTLGHALGAARPGQTVLLRAGSYDERATATQGGHPGAPITIRSYPRERAVVRGMLTIEADWIQIAGLQFTAGARSRSDDVLVYISGGDHVELTGNDLGGSPMSAIFVGDGGDVADDVRIRANRIHDNGDSSQFHHGIYCGHANGVAIVNNIVEYNAAFGIQAYPDCDNADIANNTVVANRRSGVIVGGDGEAASTNIRIVNNIIARNGDAGVQGYWESEVGTGSQVIRNLLWGNAGGSIVGDGIATTRNISAAPRFVNLSGRSYGLRRGSPAIGKALIGLSPGRDLASRARGASRDLGALEAVPNR